MRLRLKLSILLLPPVMLPLIGIGWLANKELRDETYRAALDQMQDGLALTIHEVGTLMTTTRANIELLTGSEQMKQFLRSSTKKQQQAELQDSLARLFKHYQRTFPEYLDIRLLHTNGAPPIPITATGPPAGAKNEITDPSSRASLGKGSDLYTELRSKGDGYVLHVYRSLPLSYKNETSEDDHHSHHGFLEVTVSLRTLFHNLEKHRIGTQGRILLIANDDQIIFDTHHQASNMRLPVVLRQRVKSAAGIVRPSRYYLLNQPFLILSKSLDSNLHAIAAYPAEELEKPLIKPKVAVLLGTLSALILYSSLVYGGLQRIVLRPLKALHRATIEFGNGNLTPSIGVRSRDEFGDMASSLQKMGEKLAHSSKEAE